MNFSKNQSTCISEDLNFDSKFYLFFMISILIQNLSKDLFLSPILVPISTKSCQLRFRSQELKPPIFTLQTRYSHNIGQNTQSIYIYIYSISRKRYKMQTNYIKLVRVLEYATDSGM